MAEKAQSDNREYIIPLRREWRKVANYRRAGRAAKHIKKFIAKHMKVPDRDVSKVKLDIYLNNEVWFRGKQRPPAKIKVRARKEGDLIKVTLAEIPEHIKFLKAKHQKFHKEDEKSVKEKETTSEEPIKPTEINEKQAEDKKKNESEKERSVAELRAKQAKQDVKMQEHSSKHKETPIRRLALKK